MRPLFRLVATARSTEVFIAAVLFVIIADGVIAEQARLSMALGAFVAGLLLAETEYRKADPNDGGAVQRPPAWPLLLHRRHQCRLLRELWREPFLLAGAVIGLIAVKAFLLIVLAKLFRFSWPAAVEIGLLLSTGGEFAFVGIGMAGSAGLIELSFASFILAVTSITMALTPLLSFVGRRLAARLTPDKPIDAELTVRPMAGQSHAIVVGYGRVGKVVCELLREHRSPDSTSTR